MKIISELDTYGPIGYNPTVKQAGNNSSAMGSSIKDGGSLASHHAARDAKMGDLTALPSPTLNLGLVAQRPVMRVHNTCYCPLCCHPGSIPCGSGNSLNKNSENPYRSSAPAGSNTRQELPCGILWSSCRHCGRIFDAQPTHPALDGVVSESSCRPCFAKEMFFAVVLLVPYCLMAFGILKVVPLA
jgi:hypothetical protein